MISKRPCNNKSSAIGLTLCKNSPYGSSRYMIQLVPFQVTIVSGSEDIFPGLRVAATITDPPVNLTVPPGATAMFR